MDKPTNLRTALIMLRELITSGNPPMEYWGICSWLNINAVIPTHQFIDLCRQWPKCRTYECESIIGKVYVDTVFPIIGPNEYRKDCATGTQWSNPTRLEFIDWAIDHLTNN